MTEDEIAARVDAVIYNALGDVALAFDAQPHWHPDTALVLDRARSKVLALASDFYRDPVIAGGREPHDGEAVSG